MSKIELETNLPRPSPGGVFSFFGVSPVNYSDSDLILNSPRWDATFLFAYVQ